MQHDISTLNAVNQKIAEIQKALVATINAVQSGRLSDPEDVRSLVGLYGSVLPGLSVVEEQLRVTTQQLVHAPRQALRTAAPEGTAPGTPARRRLADVADQLALEALGTKLGPEYIAGLQQHRQANAKTAFNNDLPQLEGAAESHRGDVAFTRPELEQPVGPTPEQQAAKRADEEHRGLVALAIGENGLLARWFSNTVYPGASGVITPQPDKNVYKADIGSLPYERLKSWPEGFYRNAHTSAFQYLLTTKDILVVIDFGKLVSEDVIMNQQAFKVFIHADTQHPEKQGYLFTHLNADLVRSVIRDVNLRLQQIHNGQ